MIRPKNRLPSKGDDTLGENQLSNQTLITEWASCVEKALDNSIQESHKMNPKDFPTPFLPKQFKGRCTGD